MIYYSSTASRASLSSKYQRLYYQRLLNGFLKKSQLMQSSTFSIFLVSKVKNTKDMMVIGKKDELVEWWIFRIRVNKFVVWNFPHLF